MPGGATSLLGGPVSPYTPPPLSPSLQAAYNKAIQGSVFDSSGNFKGVPTYPGALSPNLNSTLLPGVYGQYAAGNPGQRLLSTYNYGATNSDIANLNANMFAYGGVGGYPTSLMHNMAQYGAAGGGGQQMTLASQTGMPSAAGMGVANLMKYGMAGQAGLPEAALAQGQGPTLGMLAPFMQNAQRVPQATPSWLTPFMQGGSMAQNLGAQPSWMAGFLGAKPYVPGQG